MNYPSFVKISKLCEIFDLSEQSLKSKIPNEFILSISTGSIRYDLYGIIDYFKSKNNTYTNDDLLIDDLLGKK